MSTMGSGVFYEPPQLSVRLEMDFWSQWMLRGGRSYHGLWDAGVRGFGGRKTIWSPGVPWMPPLEIGGCRDASVFGAMWPEVGGCIRGSLEAFGVWKETEARNCKDLLVRGETLSGWYTIYPTKGTPMLVFCDMETDGGGWLQFQRRQDGSVDFYCDWESYKKGFGMQESEFWLGNDKIHLLTSSGTQQLRIDLEDFSGSKTFAKYSSFRITNESENYKLMLGSYLDGNMGDSLSGHNDHAFSTKDRDNDIYDGNCAVSFKGAWWYTKCHSSNLNGLYHKGEHTSYADGINWHSGKGHHYSYKYTAMKIRPQ